MQRFRITNVYVTAVLLVLVGAITAVTVLKATTVTPPSMKADPIADATAMKMPSEGASIPKQASKQIKVAIDNFKFTPKELSIAVGDTVTWVNRDDVPHTVTSKDDSAVLNSKALDTDDKFSFRFTKPGTYKYYCKVHTHMTGSITVK